MGSDLASLHGMCQTQIWGTLPAKTKERLLKFKKNKKTRNHELWSRHIIQTLNGCVSKGPLLPCLECVWGGGSGTPALSHV